jgi:hypothetical protein
MWLAALALVVWFVATHGVVRQADEGAAARIFQLVLGAQVPIVLWFAITSPPRAPRQAAAAVLCGGRSGYLSRPAGIPDMSDAPARKRHSR